MSNFGFLILMWIVGGLIQNIKKANLQKKETKQYTPYKQAMKMRQSKRQESTQEVEAGNLDSFEQVAEDQSLSLKAHRNKPHKNKKRLGRQQLSKAKAFELEAEEDLSHLSDWQLDEISDEDSLSEDDFSMENFDGFSDVDFEVGHIEVVSSVNHHKSVVNGNKPFQPKRLNPRQMVISQLILERRPLRK